MPRLTSGLTGDGQMRRVNDRKVRRALHRWLALERRTGYRTAHDGYVARLRMFRQTLGF